MSILQRIRSDLDRGLLEHRAKVLLEVIRQRIGEMTLGDLREILASKLGQGLAALKLIELTGGTDRATPALPRATKGKATKAKSTKATKAKSTKAKSTKGKGKATKAAAGTFGAELLEKVWDTLRAAGVPMTSGELRAALGGSKATMYRAVRELVRAGKLATAGKPARYSVTAGGESARAEPAAPANAATPDAVEQTGAKKSAGKKTAGKKTSGKKTAGKKTSAKRNSAKQAAAKKSGAKQSGAKKSGAKQSGAKKSAAKQSGAKKSGAKQAGEPANAESVSARTAEGRAQYDDALVAALREAGEWVGATRLREAIGGSDNQVRIALRRLIAEGKVARRGARNATEYRLGG